MRTQRHTSQTIIPQARTYSFLRDRLIAEIPDIDQETLADTLEGISDLPELLTEILRSALNDEALVVGLASRVDDMKERLARFETRAKRKRDLVRRAMAEADIQKLTVPDFTASLKQSAPSLDVLAEDQIPPAYWKPQPSKLDKQGLLAALKSGTVIEGAALAAPQLQLSVRTK
jgi:hypothetical protein